MENLDLNSELHEIIDNENYAHASPTAGNQEQTAKERKEMERIKAMVNTLSLEADVMIRFQKLMGKQAQEALTAIELFEDRNKKSDDVQDVATEEITLIEKELKSLQGDMDELKIDLEISNLRIFEHKTRLSKLNCKCDCKD